MRLAGRCWITQPCRFAKPPAIPPATQPAAGPIPAGFQRRRPLVALAPLRPVGSLIFVLWLVGGLLASGALVSGAKAAPPSESLLPATNKGYLEAHDGD